MASTRLLFFISFSCYSICYGFNILELNYKVGPKSPSSPLIVNSTFETTPITKGKEEFGFWLAFDQISFTEHISTFVAAPFTFYEEGRTVDEIPLWELFANGAVIDVRDKVSKNSSYEVSAEDVEAWVEKNGMFPPHCIVLFNTGWDEGRYPDEQDYFGTTEHESFMEFPGVSLEAIKAILSYEETDGIYFVGFGIDAPLLDRAPSKDYPVVHHVAEQNKYIVCSLKDLKRVPATGAIIKTLPLNIRGGEGAPARVAAQL